MRASDGSSFSRPFNFRLGFGLPLLAALMMLAFGVETLDFSLSRMAYVPGEGFIGRHSWFLENVLHDWAKQAVIAIGALVLLGLVLSIFTAALKPHRRLLGYLVLALGLSTGMVTPLKRATGMHCPWSLTEFGGREIYSPLLGPRAPAVEEAGRCWPGGHASAGFSLMALFFALRDRRPRLARGCLAFAIALGAVFSAGRILQGAHFLSHNIWTALLDWLICLALYRGMLYSPRPVPAALNSRPAVLSNPLPAQD